jgi:hypothetical protein
MITFVALKNGRWLIECNGIRGPSTPYEGCAFWPNDVNPELIGHSAYFDDERVWSIKQIEKIDDFKDESL